MMATLASSLSRDPKTLFCHRLCIATRACLMENHVILILTLARSVCSVYKIVQRLCVWSNMQALLHAATGLNLVEISREIAVIFFAFNSPTGTSKHGRCKLFEFGLLFSPCRIEAKAVPPWYSKAGHRETDQHSTDWWVNKISSPVETKKLCAFISSFVALSSWGGLLLVYLKLRDLRTLEWQ